MNYESKLNCNSRKNCVMQLIFLYIPRMNQSLNKAKKKYEKTLLKNAKKK